MVVAGQEKFAMSGQATNAPANWPNAHLYAKIRLWPEAIAPFLLITYQIDKTVRRYPWLAGRNSKNNEESTGRFPPTPMDHAPERMVISVTLTVDG